VSGVAVAGARSLPFRDAGGVAAELDALVAAERECCPFLTLTVVRAGGAVVLEVAAPAEAQPMVDAMSGAPDERQATTPGRPGRAGQIPDDSRSAVGRGSGGPKIDHG
jgi:hypothetical protein